MKLSGIIKHLKSVDVAFQIWHCREEKDSVVLQGMWLNQGFTRSWPILHDTIKILKPDIHSWLLCITPEEKCLRDATWKSL